MKEVTSFSFIEISVPMAKSQTHQDGFITQELEVADVQCHGADRVSCTEAEGRRGGKQQRNSARTKIQAC